MHCTVQTKYERFSSQRIVLEATADKTKWSYMVLGRDQFAVKFHILKIGNKTL
jgi:hypothetical protein